MFLLYGDFFNVEGNRIGGKHASTGIISMTCVNLPLTICDDSAYGYHGGFIEGPHEPRAKEAHHRHYLHPLIDEFLVAYNHGMQFFGTYASQQASRTPFDRMHQIAIAGLVMDLKAACPFAGLLDVTSHAFCFTCNLWHVAHVGHTDCEAWGPADDRHLRRSAEMWRDVSSKKHQTAIEQSCRTCYSELWCLPYWKPSCQVIVDPMHTMFLNVQASFFRNALRLENPHNTEKPKNKHMMPSSNIAYHYDFFPLLLCPLLGCPRRRRKIFFKILCGFWTGHICHPTQELCMKVKCPI